MKLAPPAETVASDLADGEGRLAVRFMLQWTPS
jgi:hypothetical protein